ncbi:NYN domain-containing protein [Saccharomonospora piscinae]|uniref:NYN domain-containing protein n=1 Tax=Saccharomonospora piscinae TaxID=687388 RepID=UPI00110752FB|nr:NYN domain-containing protein [Saccharomonospora piscinae]TLW89220.1 NYN domain-containing protein [Saccharomonospora piscinae]
MTLYVYVDNSNIWIEGQRIQAVRSGKACDIRTALEQKLYAHWTYDFGRLYDLLCPAGQAVGRSILFGSRPPENDSIWQKVRDADFEVETFDRSTFTNREKQVDIGLSTKMLDDSYEYMNPANGDMAVLAAGDADFLPATQSLQRRGLKVRVVSWSHAVSHKLRDTADEFVALDPHFDHLSRAPEH